MNPSEIDQCLPLISVSGTILVQKYLERFVRPQTLGGPKTPHILQNGEIGFYSTPYEKSLFVQLSPKVSISE